MTASKNPFAANTAQHDIWEMLVTRDIAAFVASDWSMVAPDFIEEGFTALHANFSRDPKDWALGFPDLATYKAEWLRQAAETAATRFAEPLAAGIHRATDLSRIEVTGDAAIAHKRFDGTIDRADGTQDRLNWQTMYLCCKHQGRWKIAGFTGYLAYL